MFDSSCLIDITLPFSERLPVWPGDAPVQIHRTTDVATVSELRLSSHVGTHLDAPAHFLPQGRTVEQLRLETLIGPAWLADVGDASPVTAQVLDQAGIPAGVERLLLKTMNSTADRALREDDADRMPFDTGFVAIDQGAARWLLDRRFQLIGIDAPSIEPYGTSDFPVHRLLLGADVIIVENLRLQDVPTGSYRLICLPLPYEGGDGAPVRAVLETNRPK